MGEAGKPCGAEFFDAEAGHGAAVEDGAAEFGVGDVGAAAEVAEESAGKGVACSGWVVDGFEGVCGRCEDAVVGEEECAVFAFFDDEGFGAEGSDDAG